MAFAKQAADAVAALVAGGGEWGFLDALAVVTLLALGAEIVSLVVPRPVLAAGLKTLLPAWLVVGGVLLLVWAAIRLEPLAALLAIAAVYFGGRLLFGRLVRFLAMYAAGRVARMFGRAKAAAPPPSRASAPRARPPPRAPTEETVVDASYVTVARKEARGSDGRDVTWWQATRHRPDGTSETRRFATKDEADAWAARRP